MIHKYNLLGNNICLDVHSGAVHILDDISYKMLDYLDENMTENIPDSVIEAMSGEYSEEDLTETYNDLSSSIRWDNFSLMMTMRSLLTL